MDGLISGRRVSESSSVLIASLHAGVQNLALINNGHLFCAARRVAFPMTAAWTLPVKLLGLEATMIALVTRQFLRIPGDQTLDER
jgi:hypothetical protein